MKEIRPNDDRDAIDRLTMLLCGLPIKEAEFLFRGPNRLTP